MSELERKNLIINNHCQHLLNTYSVPGPVPGLFPGITSFTLPNNSRRQKPLSPLFRREGNRGFREVTGHFPNCAEWYTVAKNISRWVGKKNPIVTHRILQPRPRPRKFTMHIINILKALRSPVVEKSVKVSATSVQTSRNY